MSTQALNHPRNGADVVLLTGATGFVGRAVLRRLAEAGASVRAVGRTPLELPDAAEVRPIGDLAQPLDWSPHLEGVSVIVHLAARVHVMKERAARPLAAFRAVNVEATLRLAQAAAKSGVRRFVFLSTIKVNGERTVGVPFSPSDTAAPLDPYAQSKLEAEVGLQQLAAQGAFELVILRPPLVYGPGVGGNLRRLLRLIALGVPLPFGLVRNRRSLIGLENLASAVVRGASPDAKGGTYLLSDGPPVSTPGLIRAIAGGLGRSALLVPIPPGLLRLAGAVTGRVDEVARLVDSLEVDSSAARSGLGWTPALSFERGIRLMTDWYLELQREANG